MQLNENKKPVENLIPGYLKDELSAEEKRELITWIKEDKSNKRYFDEYCEIWITARASLKNPGYNFQEGFWKFKQKIQTQEHISESLSKISKISKFRTILRYAAIFIAAFSLSGILFYYLSNNQIKYPNQSFSELVVPMGSRARFTLSDGTTAILNAGSSLKFDNRFGLKDRVVQLEGEGYFIVAKDTSRPFIVKTSYLNVMAVGTAFNVKAYSDDKTIETTLVEGSVKIEGTNKNMKTETLVLIPNQKLTFYKEDSTMVDEASNPTVKPENDKKPAKLQKSLTIPRLVRENVDVEPVISWKENRWIFEKERLSQIAVELERKFDIQINFDSERLKAYRFTGIIVAEPIEQVLEVMSLSAPISYKLKGRVVTLSENKNFEKLNKSLYNQQ